MASPIPPIDSAFREARMVRDPFVGEKTPALFSAPTFNLHEIAEKA